MIRRPPRSTLSSSSAASDVYKRQPSYKRSFHATPTITTQFQALFTTIFWMLFSFRSPYYYAIGLKTYLVLEVDVPLIPCLLYTSDAADEEDSVDLGGRRIIKKKKKKNSER